MIVNYTKTIKMFHTCQIFITNQMTSSGLVCYDTVLQQMDYCKVVMYHYELLPDK